MLRFNNIPMPYYTHSYQTPLNHSLSQYNHTYISFTSTINQSNVRPMNRYHCTYHSRLRASSPMPHIHIRHPCIVNPTTTHRHYHQASVSPLSVSSISSVMNKHISAPLQHKPIYASQYIRHITATNKITNNFLNTHL